MADERAGFDKVNFRLKRDEDGFPPADVESLWAKKREDGCFVIDNVPFFVTSIGVGDAVEAVEIKGQLWFRRVVEESGHGTIRLLMKGDGRGKSASMRETIATFGCSSELSHLPNYVAVDVPPSCDKKRLLEFLEREVEAGRLEYEEGCKTW